MNLVLTPEQIAYIHKEMCVPQSRSEQEGYVTAIREWLDTQPHLPKNIEDEFLLRFVSCCQFSLEKVKEKLDKYFTVRLAVPEIFTNRDIKRKELSVIFDIVQTPILPCLTAECFRILIIRPVTFDFQPHQMYDFMKVSLMIADYNLFVNKTPECCGQIIIMDAEYLKPSDITKVTPTVLKQYFLCTAGYPDGIKQIHIINTSPIVFNIFNILKPVLKEKMRNRIMFHSNMDSLYKSVPKNVLPKEYGGDIGSIADFNMQWMKILEDATEWFKKQESIKGDESLRPASSKTSSDLFGAEGSFKKLNFD